MTQFVFLVDALARCLFVGLVAVAVLAISRRLSPAHRHLGVTAALIAMALIPLAYFALPPRTRELSTAGMAEVLGAAPAEHQPEGAAQAQPAEALAGPRTVHVAQNLPFMANWGEIAFAAYSIVFASLLARLGAGFWQAWRLWRAAAPVQPGVRLSPSVQGPVSLAGFSTRILLPRDALTWSDEALQAVLAHERSHGERLDGLTQLAGHVACALNWANPLGWYLARRQRELAEEAADDQAIESGTSGHALAQSLLDLSQRTAPSFEFGIPFAPKGTVRRRVERALARDVRRTAAPSWARLACFVLTLGCGGYYGQRVVLSSTVNPGRDLYVAPGTPPQPGRANNGFVAILSDERAVRLERLTTVLADGRRLDWLPGGSFVKADGIDYFAGFNTQPEKLRGYVALVFRFQSKAAAKDVDAGTLSAQDLPGWPAPRELGRVGESMTFAGGGVSGQGPAKTCVSLMKFEGFEPGTTRSLQFSLSDGDWSSYVTWNHKAALPSGQAPGSPTRLIDVRPKASVPILRDVPVVGEELNEIVVEHDLDPLRPDNVRCVAVDEKGAEHALYAGQSAYSGDTFQVTYTLKLSKGRIRQIRLDRRPALQTRFDGIVINPTARQAR